MQKQVADWFRQLQERICGEFLKIDPSVTSLKNNWERPGGGGGDTRVLRKGKIIEKGGVNFSAVHGDAPAFLLKQFSTSVSQKELFFATGISIVIHPVSPEVPIIHMNTRYLELGNISWFGGGIDLTPHYIDKHDAALFHTGLKKMCDGFHPSYYHEFKKNADDYFFLPHRNETRGIGGIFFDQLREEDNIGMEDRFEFVRATGESFLPIFMELIDRNKNKKFTEREIRWQHLRRGRYAEFNLLYDRGTKFGLETNGRTESILMSLPPIAEWEYDFKPEPRSREEITLGLLRKGIDWMKP